MKVILPGSYDPITLGHLDIIERASRLYEKVYAVIFVNPEKEYMFSLEDRVHMLSLATERLENVFVDSSDGYVVDYMREHGMEKIIKGYRNDKDLEYEKIQAEYNFKNGGYETELWKANEKTENISSTIAREMIVNGGDLSEVLAEKVKEYISNLK